jgi:CheY-like chemotaxis protein/HPt (histidine-containing phosphotransfer) domain-containing protein
MIVFTVLAIALATLVAGFGFVSLRKMREAEESNKAKNKFLATMSHEIRTPMNAILGITEIQLRDESLAPQVKEAFSEIYNSGELLMGIINDILDLSKIEADKMELKLTKYEVASLINDAVHLNMMRNSKPVEFKLIVDENTPFELFGDELRIKQILNNLLSNAYKYTDAGKIELSISVMGDAEHAEEEQATLVFRISDTGQGMTEKQMKLLFTTEYARFNLDANHAIEGTGLGLNIVWRLVKIMGGNISVDSEPNRGSVFTVRLPQKKVSSRTMGKEITENLQNFRISTSYKAKYAKIAYEYMPYGKVLVVDDVMSNLYVAKGLISPYGLSIDTAFSGFDAIEKVKAGRKYDIIFMDHFMPNMDGIEATKIIRDLGYKHPIVALTANAVVGQSKLFLENGFDDFISKPIDIRQLTAVLNRLIRDKQSPETIAEARKQRQNQDESVLHSKASKSLEELQAIFPLDVKNVLPVIENTLRNINNVTAKDLRLFTVNVHAIKSALANIGETAASKLAFVLEKAGKERDIGVIKAHAKMLIDEIRSINDRIKAKKKTLDSIRDIDEDPVFLQEQLQIIYNACVDYDERPVNAAIAALEKLSWRRETQAIIDRISEYMLYGDFEEVRKLAYTSEEVVI